jgi:hypothetical protein
VKYQLHEFAAVRLSVRGVLVVEGANWIFISQGAAGKDKRRLSPTTASQI